MGGVAVCFGLALADEELPRQFEVLLAPDRVPQLLPSKRID
jgi:hypothetical protein